MNTTKQNFHEPGVRQIGVFNGYGLRTHFMKEVRRFFKVWTQTVAAPAVTTSLFMLVFSIALGGNNRMIGDIPFVVFLAPGLTIMAIVQNAYQNPTSSLIIGKVQGNIIDVLMPPLSPFELVMGYVGGGVVRGLTVGVVVWACFYAALGDGVAVQHFWAVLYYSVMGATMLSLMGVLSGVWSSKFDHAAAITNFIVAPLSLLSGTFYTIDRLDASFQVVLLYNPFFYLIDGFRYGFIGQADSNLAIGMAYVFAINLVLWFYCHRVFKTGWRLKA